MVCYPKMTSSLNIRKYFLTERVVAVWNNLENVIIKFSSLKFFKDSLFLCNLSKYVSFQLGLHIGILLLFVFCV